MRLGVMAVLAVLAAVVAAPSTSAPLTTACDPGRSATIATNWIREYQGVFGW
jgi:hypothetical protein